PVLHHVADRRRVAPYGHVHRADCVAKHAREAVGAGRMHDPGPGPLRLSLLAHRVDEDEVTLLVAAAEAVDDQLVRGMEGNLDDVFGVALAGEETGHVERGWR